MATVAMGLPNVPDHYGESSLETSMEGVAQAAAERGLADGAHAIHAE
jgi:hypothetical protein